MLKQLKIYYLFVSLPFILLLTGAVAFFDGIKYTIARNPHPQINFIIFCIILVGGVLILFNARRLMREAKALVQFSKAVHAKLDQTSLSQLANGFVCDIACLLQMVASSVDRSISHQEQAALEHELTNVRSRLNRRNALPSYLTGLLVGMGLLGTFIGLLATLNDISVLISSFADIDMQNASPLIVFKTMIERMKAPMQSMGIAFSASMFGLLGSIILGLMMVGIRRLQNDIFSVLSSELARHIELALSFESISFRGKEVGSAISGEAIDLNSKILFRIEERLAETARIRQRALSAEIDDFKRQRADMLQALEVQNAANNSFRLELQQLGGKLGELIGSLEKGNRDVVSQLSELKINLSGDAREAQKLLVGQIEEQKRLRDTIDSYKIEERLAEAATMQKRLLEAEIDDFNHQRGDMLQAMKVQNEANTGLRHEMQQLGSQLTVVLGSMEKSGDEISAQLSEMTVHAASDAKETHRLLNITSNNVRGELQQLGGRMIELKAQVEQGDRELVSQTAALSSQTAALASQQAQESGAVQKNQVGVQQLLSQQLEAGQQLYGELQALGSRVEVMSAAITKGNADLAGQVAELAAASNRSAAASQGQRSDLLDSLSQQLAVSSHVSSELEKLGSQFEAVLSHPEKGNGDLAAAEEARV